MISMTGLLAFLAAIDARIFGDAPPKKPEEIDPMTELHGQITALKLQLSEAHRARLKSAALYADERKRRVEAERKNEAFRNYLWNSLLQPPRLREVGGNDYFAMQAAQVGVSAPRRLTAGELVERAVCNCVPGRSQWFNSRPASPSGRYYERTPAPPGEYNALAGLR